MPPADIAQPSQVAPMTGSLHEQYPPEFTATGFVYRTLTGFPHHRACLMAVLTGDTMQLIRFLIYNYAITVRNGFHF